MNRARTIRSLFIRHLDWGLIYQAERASALRQDALLLQIASRLRETFAGDYGEFYTALALPADCRASVLEGLSESNEGWIRVRAMLALGNNLCRQGEHAQAHGLYHKAARESESNWVLATIGRNRAVIESAEGNHHRALTILESLYPRISRLDFLSRYQYLNSLAVELNAVGHKDEARKVIAPVIASPFARAFPEWHETAKEINRVEPRIFPAQVVPFPIDRARQVRRIERVIWDTRIDGWKLSAYASAGEKAISN